jgi:N-acetylmuramoyl-L-alanine amidase
MTQRRIRPSDRSTHAGIFLILASLFMSAALVDSLPERCSAAPRGRVVGIRTGPHSDSLRVVLDLEGSPECVIRAIDGSEDWEIIVKGVCPSNPPPQLTPGGCLISVESTCEGADLRVLLRAARQIEQSAFRIPARGGKPGRFVVDLWPVGGGSRPAAEVAPTPSGGPVEPGAGDVKPRENKGATEEPGAIAPSSKSSSPQPRVPEPAPRRTGNFRILIDPGHGGDDPGARRTGIKEKEIVLDVGRRVAAALNAAPGFEARLSRDDDRRIPLRQRMNRAEKDEADAFISIHVNAAKRKDAYGVEVFYLSLGGASDEASKDLARQENEADPEYVVSEDSLLQGFPFGFDLRQSDTLLRSSRLAESVLLSFETSHLAASRGVKQAGFAVLKSYQVPSALVEIGFLSNPDEARRLKDAKHRQKLADCIVKGTIEYFGRFARAKAGPE